MDVTDPVVHVELEVIDLVFDVSHLFIFFMNKCTNFFKFELDPSHLLDPQGDVIDVNDKLLRIIG